MYIINLSQDKSKISNYISNTLLLKIEENLKNNKKIILYLNKRWEYSSLICKDCNYFYKCPNCDTSLVVHKNNKIICHICSYSKDLPLTCKKCNSTNLEKIGVWTQQIEKALKNYFKNINIFRFDLDSVKNKKEKNKALENIKNAQIIIWTKMITTGFDLENIWLISIILIEQELINPSYNTEEKAFINIKQIIWRWSRKWEKTTFLIQTYIPENPSVKMLIQSNYKNFFLQTINERKIFNYPPLTELVTIEYRNKNKQKALDFSQSLFNKLNFLNKEKEYEIIFNKTPFKKYNTYHYKIIIKWKNLRSFLENIKNEVFKNSNLNIIFS